MDDEEEFQDFLTTLGDSHTAVDGVKQAGTSQRSNRIPEENGEAANQLQGSQADASSGTCHFCEQVFASATALRKHFDDNMIDNRHICQGCGASFRHPSRFQRHHRIHTRAKPYRCGACGSEFSQPENLRRHVRSHNKEKPFVCNTCAIPFTRKDNLEAHVRKRHREVCEADTAASKKMNICIDQCA